MDNEASGLALGSLSMAGFVLHYDMMIRDTITGRHFGGLFRPGEVYFLQLNLLHSRNEKYTFLHRP